jgi:pyruvate/2-oxoacid:ferredoxin oxidoreductase beta subunit
MQAFIYPVVTAIVIALIASLMLALAAKFMSVPVNETQVKIREQLPGANCGACGFAGCDDYAAALAEEGKTPFQLDSKEPDWDKFQDFLEGEVRFLSLKKAAPEEAQELYDACKAAAQRRYKTYVRKTQEDWSL